MDDSFDLYGDLLSSTHLGVPEDSQCQKELAAKTEILEKELNVLKKQLEDLESANNNLKLNFSSLIKTAKSEISRKDSVITDLRAKLDNVTFRRNQRPQPYPRKQEPPSIKSIPCKQERQNTVDHSLKYPPSLLDLELPIVNNHRAVDEQTISDSLPSTDIIKQDHINIHQDSENVDEEFDEVTTDKLEYKKTLYGERLHKKIMEIEESDKRKKAEENVKKKEEELRLKHAPLDKVNNKENLSVPNKSTHQIDGEAASNKISDSIKNDIDTAIDKSEITKMKESHVKIHSAVKSEGDNWPKFDKQFSAKNNIIAPSNNQWHSQNGKYESRNSPVNQDYRNRHHDVRRDNYERHRHNTSRYKEPISKYNRRDSRYDYHKNSNNHNSRFKEEIRGRYGTRDDAIRSYEKEKRKRENMETLKRMRRSVSEDRILHDSKRRKIAHEDIIHSCNSRKEFIEMSGNNYSKSRKNREESEERKEKKHNLEKLISDQNWNKEMVKPHMILENSQTHKHTGETLQRHNDSKIINNDKENKDEMTSKPKENSRENDAKTSKSNESKVSRNVDELQAASSIEKTKKEEIKNAHNDGKSKVEQCKKNNNLVSELNGIMKHEKSSKQKETSRVKDTKTTKHNERKSSENNDTLQHAVNIKKVKKEEVEKANNDVISKLEQSKENNDLNSKLNGVMKQEKSSKPKENSRENDAKTSKSNESKVSRNVDELQAASSIEKTKKEEIKNAHNDGKSKVEQCKKNNNLDSELNGIIKHEKSSKQKEGSRVKNPKTSKSSERKSSENNDTLQPAVNIIKVKEEVENANNDVTSKLEQSKEDKNLDSELNGMIKETEKSLEERNKGGKSSAIDNSDINKTFENESEINELVVKEKSCEENVNLQKRSNKVRESREKRVIEKVSKAKTNEIRVDKEPISNHHNQLVDNVNHVHQNSVSNDYAKNLKSSVEKEISNGRDKIRDRRKETIGNDGSCVIKKTKDIVKIRNSSKVIEDAKLLREKYLKTEDHCGRKISFKIKDYPEKSRTEEKTKEKISERKRNQIKSLFSNEITNDEKLKQKKISNNKDKRSESDGLKNNSCSKQPSKTFESDNKSIIVGEKLDSGKREKENSSKRKEHDVNSKITKVNDEKLAVKEKPASPRKCLAKELEDGEIIEDGEIVEDDEIVNENLPTAKPGNSVDFNQLKTSIKTGINAFVSTESQVETRCSDNNKIENIKEKADFHTNSKKESETLRKSRIDEKLHVQVTNENPAVNNINQTEACVEELKNKKELSLKKLNSKNESSDKNSGFQLVHEKIKEKTSKENVSNTKSEKQRNNIDESKVVVSSIPRVPEESDKENKEICLIKHNSEEKLNEKLEINSKKLQVVEKTVKNMSDELNSKNTNEIFQNDELKANETTCEQETVSEPLLQKKETNSTKKKANISKLKGIKNIIVVKRRRNARVENKLMSNSPELMGNNSQVMKCSNPDEGSENKVEGNIMCSKTEDKNNEIPVNITTEKLKEQIQFFKNVEIKKDVPEINEETNIKIDKEENACDSNKLLDNTIVESSGIETKVKEFKIISKKKSVSIVKPNTMKNVILVKRRRRPVQLADSPPVRIPLS